MANGSKLEDISKSLWMALYYSIVQPSNISTRERPIWLSLIALFFNPRVIYRAFHLTLAVCVMTKFRRLGFFWIMLSVALG